LHVMLQGIKAGSDGTDHLAIDANGKSALHLGQALRRNATTRPWLIAASSA
jgi:hypothetical protein